MPRRPILERFSKGIKEPELPRSKEEFEGFKEKYDQPKGSLKRSQDDMGPLDFTFESTADQLAENCRGRRLNRGRARPTGRAQC